MSNAYFAHKSSAIFSAFVQKARYFHDLEGCGSVKQAGRLAGVH